MLQLVSQETTSLIQLGRAEVDTDQRDVEPCAQVRVSSLP